MPRFSSLKTDILIVGGNHSGLTLAACLGSQGIKVTVLEQKALAPAHQLKSDGRTLAFSYRSAQLLKKCGVWPLIQKQACPILDIRVADQGASSHLDFHHDEVGSHPFGWIVENHLFNAALQTRLRAFKSVHIEAPAALESYEAKAETVEVRLHDGRRFEAALLIGADGRQSMCRALAHIPTYGWSYHQKAVVCIIAHSLPHHSMALEHFHPGGPFAILPMTQQRSSIVWTEKTATADHLMGLADQDFARLLQEKIGTHLGKVKVIGKRFAYPLNLKHAEHYIAPRMALVGDAAHGVHPIAGQGFNLGMGDIEVLVDELRQAAHLGLDLGGADLLARYEKRRKMANGNMVLMTDLLDRLFSNAVPFVQAARRFGLDAVQHMPPLRRFFMRTAMGLDNSVTETNRKRA
jgi:2-octaprenyl-6-methoxyphenol hydroxylase